ncbi:NAD(P)-dependent oxidoreductase [Pseudogemmobacter faecipullorum]|uniref:NAD(P)-dependent oxidoreductase n=1 Tax=Pseudogemmobacter faecipullorum TaxID=2755041 RepID=A0ABS8CKV0_9RHOB|nr:NAD(P)-dependent oxidoreductase [Pseudogemmobacter faecipullorum]MCB5409783.1 NAD(P)-dependent oxidoreductase [Pseudogemmobacter faecipullorum]
MRYGYIGLGNLGGNLALSLLRAGFDLTVYDQKPELTRPLAEHGAVVAASLEELAGQVDHIFTCLPSPAASEAVLAGLLEHLPAGASWIENSTLGREDVLRLAGLARSAGIRMFEAPVTGGVHLAARGEITVLAAGDQDLYDLHFPALEAMGGQIFYMGGLGSAAVIKVITNMLAFIHLVADGEALMLAKRGGLDLKTAWAAIAASSGSSFVHETEGQLVLNGSYDVGFSMDLALKDLGFALGFGREFGVPLDLASLVSQTFLRGRAAYGGQAQSTQIVKLLEDLLGTDLRAEGFPARLE